jgi:NAD(P)-dependent dehydrogenase (short-subunit alcohol dehydrogenase family)
MMINMWYICTNILLHCELFLLQTQLRAVRLRQLEQLNDEGFQPRVPDGVAICDLTEAKFDASNKMLLGNDNQIGADAKATLLLGDVGAPEQSLQEGGELVVSASSTATLKSLINPISCYICHKPYVELHFFYHQLCPACAAFNYAKREEKANLSGKVCLVTGGRTKIGYRSALKLLRCGSRVVVTTRFPHDAAIRFAAEKDCNNWLDNLDIYGLDFRDLRRLEEFCSYLQITYERLDVIINNACQTIRRPPAYYQHLIADEVQYAEEGTAASTAALPICDAGKKIDKILKKQTIFSTVQSESYNSTQQMKLQNNGNGGSDVSSTNSTVAADGIKALSSLASVADIHQPATNNSDNSTDGLNSVQLSQLMVAPGDDNGDPTLFPTGSLDVNRQQVDLRKHNSWTMKLDEVSTPELAEVFAINTMAPTILNARLKGMMQRNPDDLKFIVNVSAMEGKFYRFKSERHPHTNMAKAALNMLTRTSAQDYIKSNIHMTSVDTGWINDEKPIDLAVKHEKKHKFQTPLDEIDAAARVLDPVIGPLNALDRGEVADPPWGVFLKDYMKCEW